MPYFSLDDIAQIGTAPAPALLGVLRLSGPGVFPLLAKAAAGLEEILAGRPGRGIHSCGLRLSLRRYRGGRGTDWEPFSCPARVLLFPAPRSYTREDMAELLLPGSPALLGAGLAALVAAGAREAAPGEFTFRAFRNGRLSLGQAEAVEAVIRAESAGQSRAALFRLGDANREAIGKWRESALDLAARIEARLDFPEEEPAGDFARELSGLAADLERAGAAAADFPEAVVPGWPRLALVGRPNAGKSSLFNRLLGSEASLVSPAASTTRDSLLREVEWEGTRLSLSDNPGYHPEGDAGQKMASDLGRRRLAGNDIICWVLDASVPLDSAAGEFAGELGANPVVLLNKRDLPEATGPGEIGNLLAGRGLAAAAIFRVSARTGAGLEEARRFLAELAAGTGNRAQWSRRESLELAAALAFSREAGRELAAPERLELAADSLRRAAESFSRALGEGYAETVLARIFSSFCLGK
ncbi:MAG: 50S ribosome-binding GTPase [Planctomycetota bacterium]|nr:50S ribosome-binding GTPase [Planctomycetota bacterium]